MSLPRISVLVPCFNDGAYIDEALDSVFAQTYGDFEVVIVDDGSTDESTVRKLQTLQRPRTSVFRTENRGLPAARNYAASQANGDLFCALDADDRLAPAWFERAVAVLDSQPEIAFVSHWLETFGDQHWVWKPERCDLPALLAHNTINGAALVRRMAFEAVEGYEESMRGGCEDWDFWLRIVEHGYQGAIVPEVLFYYRRRPESMSRAMTDDRGYPKPLAALLQRHAPYYRQHVTELLTESEAESVRVRGEIARLERDALTVVAPGLARAREEVAAARSKTASYRAVDRLTSERDRSNEALAQLTDAHRDLVSSYERLGQELANVTEARDAALASCDQVSEARNTAVASRDQAFDARDLAIAERDRLGEELSTVRTDRDRLAALTARLSGDVQILQREVAALRGSLSWRSTAVLRHVHSWLLRKP
jgi:hypothetical protein